MEDREYKIILEQIILSGMEVVVQEVQIQILTAVIMLQVVVLEVVAMETLQVWVQAHQVLVTLGEEEEEVIGKLQDQQAAAASWSSASRCVKHATAGNIPGRAGKCARCVLPGTGRPQMFVRLAPGPVRAAPSAV